MAVVTEVWIGVDKCECGGIACTLIIVPGCIEQSENPELRSPTTHRERLLRVPLEVHDFELSRVMDHVYRRY